MKTLLVTGGSGALGWTLLRRLRGRWRLIATWCRHPLEMEGVESRRLDLEERGAAQDLVLETKPHAVIHTASLAKPDLCETHEEAAFAVNARGTGEIARASRKAGARLVYISTDLVFDGTRGSYVETDSANPVSVYGRSKLAGETEAAECADSIVLRSALIFGWGSPWSPTFLDWMVGRLSERETVRLFTDQHRSPVYIEDLAAAVERVTLSGPTGVFHAGGRVRTDRLTFGRRVCEVFGFPERLVEGIRMDELPGAAPRPADCSLDSTRFERTVGFAFGGVEEGLAHAFAVREPGGVSGVDHA